MGSSTVEPKRSEFAIVLALTEKPWHKCCHGCTNVVCYVDANHTAPETEVEAQEGQTTAPY